MNTRLRRAAASLAAGLLVAGLVDLTLPASSNADDPPLQVAGTSDASDSGLMAYLSPKILAATGVAIKYNGSASLDAINAAKAGSDALMLVHAASLENQFVKDGYSKEDAGRSLMWGDFVLAGSRTDPASVDPGTDYSHDVVAAFHQIALAGANGGGTAQAHFVSRSGAPGTTVQEHAIWKLVDQTYNHDVQMCVVSSALGGGMTPGAPTSSSDPSCPSTVAYPAWYNSGGRKQGDNVTFTNACSITSTPSANDCYVFTDRGTFQNLDNNHLVDQLKILVRNNASTAPGGLEALINAFHIYVVNHAAVPPNSINDEVRATAVMKWLTSPDGQAAIGGYLASDPPFIPAAAPVVSLTQPLPASTAGSTSFTVAGHVGNAIPGYPRLDGLPVNLTAVPTSRPSAAPAVVASATSDANGNFTLPYSPAVSMTYSLSIPQATRLENASLDPTFSDILVGSTRLLGVSSVNASFAAKASKNHQGRKLRVKGTLRPQVTGAGATLVLYRAKQGRKHALHAVASRALPAGATSYSLSFKFPRGKWKYVLVYQNPGVITPAATGVRKVSFR